MVVPTGKANPLGGLLIALASAQLSLAVTVNVTSLAHRSGTAFTVIDPGQLIAGGCVSSTITLNVQALLLPAPSRAVVVTVVDPTGKAKPLAGTLVTLVTAQLSVAVTLKVTLLVHAPSAPFTVRLAGQLITGG